VSLLDHIYIISTVTDGKRDSLGVSLSDSLDQLSFLTRGSSVDNKAFGCEQTVYKVFFLRGIIFK
jgi:hypothetical protein